MKKLFQCAILLQKEDGETELQGDVFSILATDLQAAEMQAKETIPADLPLENVTIILKEFI